METQKKGWGIQTDRKKGLKKDIQRNELSKSTNEFINREIIKEKKETDGYLDENEQEKEQMQQIRKSLNH